MFESIKKPWGTERIMVLHRTEEPDDCYCIKHIIAESNLSLQVHFDKDETFIAIKDSVVYVLPYNAFLNLISAIDYNKFDEICKSEEILNYLTEIKLPKGAAYKVPKNTIHYIRGGSDILEYSSGLGSIEDDSTYRLLDWYEPKRDTHVFTIYSRLKFME